MGRPRTPEHRVPHGTEKGYQWHYRWDIEPCARCKAAHRKYNNSRYALRKRQLKIIQQIMSQDKSNRPPNQREAQAILDMLKQEAENPGGNSLYEDEI